MNHPRHPALRTKAALTLTRPRSGARCLTRLRSRWGGWLAAIGVLTTPAALLHAQTEESSAATAAPLFRAAGATTGNALAPRSAEFTRQRLAGVKPEGRVTPLDRASFAAVGAVSAGRHVLLPLAAGEELEAVVKLVQEEAGGARRIGGVLFEAEAGSFQLSVKGAEVSGFILRPGQGLAYRVETAASGELVLREVLINEVICAPLPRMEGEPARATSDEPQAAVPLLNSRPGVAAALYLDFDGEVVTDPAWNSGQTINAASYNLSDATITAIFDRVKEDFWPFNVNVTTDAAKYAAAPVGRRMRCIITPTNTAAPGSGGVAYLNSFSRAGSSFSNTIPCWVFNSSTVGISEAISHELGHTFGLHHDGRTTPSEEYFQGHGSGATGWCPIMGAGYYQPVVQWSKGEYQSANNTEDDVAIISNTANGLGYVADEAGGSIGTAAALGRSGTTVGQSGVITQAADADFFSFTIAAGTVTINAASASASPDLDVALEVQNASGGVVLTSNPPSALAAGVSGTLPAGTYYLKVNGSGAGSALTSGYSTYGSIGSYVLTGTIPPAVAPPVPANNNFGTPRNLGTLAGLVTGNNVNATKETGEPNHAGGAGGASVWYNWQAPLNGSVTFNTFGSSLDTLLAVYTGNAVNALTTVASNDNSGGTVQSSVTFNATAGTLYRIAVDGSSNAQGNVALNWSGAAARQPKDFSGDGKADVILENINTGDRAIWIMNGGAIAGAVGLGYVPPEWHMAGSGDFNGDGKSDILIENAVTGARAVWFMADTAIAGAAAIASIPAEWRIGGAGDFNGDGRADIILENARDGSRVIWLMNGTTIASAAVLGYVPTEWRIAGVGDFNRDGKADVILENTRDGTRAIWLMDGATIASAAVIGYVPTEWRIGGTADFNLDGFSDVVLENLATGSRAIWIMNGTTISAAAGLGYVPTEWRTNNH